MDLITKENSILNLYIENENLFDKIENLAFDNVWSTSLNQMKFKIIKYYHSKNAKPDSLLINEQLRKKGFSKDDILKSQGKPDHRLEKHIEEYMKDIFDAWCKRLILPKLQNSHYELSNEAGDIDVNLDELKGVISDIEAVKNNLTADKSIHDIFDEAMADQMDLQNSKEKLPGYSTGLKDLDELCNGLKNEVIVVGARPGAGKSSLMVNIIAKANIDKLAPMLVCSLEMPRIQLMKNIWSNYLKINNAGIRKGYLSDEDLIRIKQFKHKLKDSLIIDDTPAITYQYIEAKIRKMRKTIPMNQLIFVMIDYIQLMKNTIEDSKGMSKEEQVGVRCNGLLEITKKYNLCMIELSQLSREVERRSPPRPILSDLKDSGAIEANAMQVWLLYRADYYTKDPMEDGKSLKGLCEINVGKNRYGKTGPAYVRFKGHHSAFEDYEDDSNDIKQGEGEF